MGLRIITHDASAKFSKTAYAAYGILPYHSLLKQRNVCLVHQIQHSNDAVVMPNNAFSMSTLSGWSMLSSQANKLCLVQTKKEANKLCFSINAVIYFNGLPNNVTVLISYNQFKDRVIKILLKDLSDYFYSIFDC